MQRLRSNLMLIAMIVAAQFGYGSPGIADEWLGEDASSDFFMGDSSIVDPSVQDEFVFHGRRARRRSESINPAAGIVGGAELVFLTAEYNGGGAVVGVNDFPAAFALEVDAQRADLGDFHPTPRVWMGWQNHGGGLVGRYWRFAGSESFRSRSPSDPLSPLTFADFYQRLDLYTVDLGWQRVWQMAGGQVALDAGFRYAAVEHHQYGNVLREVDGTLCSATASSLRDFHGIGPTIGWAGYHAPWQDGRWQWFWTTRSSLAWGSLDTRADALAVATGGGLSRIEQVRLQESDDFLFIGEAQLGLHHNWRLGLQRVAFVQAAGEYQYYAARRGAAMAGVSLDSPGQFQLRSSSDAPAFRLSLLGLVLGFGIRW